MMLGHTADQCRRKEPQRREWRVKEKGDKGSQDMHPELSFNEEGDGFQRVATRHTIRSPIGRNVEQMAKEIRTNSFQLLLEEDMV